MKQTEQPRHGGTSKHLFRSIAVGLIACAAAEAAAQNSYTVIDLTPSAGNAVAEGLTGGVAAGYAGAGIFTSLTRATLWDGAASADLHPGQWVDDSVTGAVGRSAILGSGDGLQAGWATGPLTGNRSVPVLWRGSAASATVLTIPFLSASGLATATDGIQVVGNGTPYIKDGTALGPARGVVWDAATGAGTDLGDAGNGAQVYGVGAGKQVGYVMKNQANAAVWSGSSRSLVVLHPSGAVLSVANATDGARQVGYAGYDVRVRQEAAKGNKDQRFNYAFLWTGTAASAMNIHPYPMNYPVGVNLTQSYALGLNGSWIVGHATDANTFGTPAASHAIVWDELFQSVDLNEFLPAGFVGAQAIAVDAQGNVAGFMSKADGTRHAVVWVRNSAQ